MLYIIFLIVFLAELIIMEWVVSKIIKCEKVVTETNNKITACRPIIKEKIKKAHSCLNTLTCCLKSFVTFVAEKKGQCKDLICKNILSTILCTITKIPFKHIITGLEIFLKIKNILK